MARPSADVQVNELTGGLNSEATPLNYPPTASLDEINLEITNNGTRSQRAGMDVEDGYVLVDTGVTVSDSQYLGRSQFYWSNPGGYADTEFLVVQVGSFLAIHAIGEGVISDSVIYSENFPTTLNSNTFSFSSVDGDLVLVNGSSDVYIYSYDGTTITKSTKRLQIRDLFGQDAEWGARDLTDPENYTYRPDGLGVRHEYNLRNQTFGPTRLNGRADNLNIIDPIAMFDYTAITDYGVSGHIFPSNADNVNQYLNPNTDYATDRIADRFQSRSMYSETPPTNRAPMGYFIIDALSRGSSREDVYNALYVDNPNLTKYNAASFVEDRTPNGATVTAQYAGRAWFGGFSNQIIDGDGQSPKMGSYVLFSQLVTTPKHITRCYQEADPTSPYDPDIVTTDGGFIQISGASNICQLLPLGNSLIVIAENGVWSIQGEDGNTFTATSSSVKKLSDVGTVYPNSVVEYNNQVFFWGKEGIHVITTEQISGDWSVQNISDASVKTLVEGVSPEQRSSIIGYFDTSKLAVRWLSNVINDDDEEPFEFIFYLKYSSFTKNSFPRVGSNVGPFTVTSGQTAIEGYANLITVLGATVTANTEDVTLREEVVILGAAQLFYTILVEDAGNYKYTFGGYTPSEYKDWDLYTSGSGVMPECYLLTGAVTAGDARGRKDIKYLTIHMPYEEGSVSCLFSAHWGWTTDVMSSRWSSLRTGYRPTDEMFYGTVVSTRNKVRGHGRSVAFKFQSDGVSPLKLYGWEFTLSHRGIE